MMRFKLVCDAKNAAWAAAFAARVSREMPFNDSPHGVAETTDQGVTLTAHYTKTGTVVVRQAGEDCE